MTNCKMVPFALCMIASLSLAGCDLDGSSSSSSNGDNHGEGDASSFSDVEVDTQERRASSDGDHFFKATQWGDNTFIGKMCGEQVHDRYIEADSGNILVYGDQQVSQDELERVARGIYKFHGELLDYFDLDAQEFREQFQSTLIDKASDGIIPRSYNDDYSRVESYLSHHHDFTGSIEREGDYIEFLVGMSGSEIYDFFKYIFSQDITDEEFKESIAYKENLSVHETSNSLGLSFDARFDDFPLVACVDSEMDRELGRGEGHIWGISIVPGGGDKLLKHELVHYFQGRIYGGTVNYGVPRWYLEGQAVSVANQNITDPVEIDGRNPIEVESFFDEPDYFDDEGGKYGDYGLAYQFVMDYLELQPSDLNKVFSRSHMSTPYFLDKQASKGVPIEELDQYEYFKEEFSKVVEDTSGGSLNYEELQDNWFDLISDGAP